jgi:LmbE family N-acetylglucosaminyl deacetylase
MSRPLVVTPTGRPAAEWEPILSGSPPLRLPARLAGERVVVVAAHPDDETLGAAGLIQTLHSREALCEVVVCTDGSAAYPGLDEPGRRQLAQVRRTETRAALASLGAAPIAVRFLGLPDGRLGDHSSELTEALAPVCHEASMLVTPWRHDPHPDHRAAGRATAALAAGGTRLLEYPIWMRHFVPADDEVARPGTLRTLPMTDEQLARKRAAIRAHASQVGRWNRAYEPVLPPHVLDLFDVPYEPFFQDAR